MSVIQLYEATLAERGYRADDAQRRAPVSYTHLMLEGQRLGYAGRPPSASPAVGYSHLHQEQQKALLEQAYGKLKGFVLSK